MAVAADIEIGMNAVDRTCFADDGTTAQEALEATPVILWGIKAGIAHQAKALFRAQGCVGSIPTAMLFWPVPIATGVAIRAIALLLADRRERPYRSAAQTTAGVSGI
jgi:hypothetical protein